jgi:hypothetical protein
MFTMSIPTNNLSLLVTYGGRNVTLPYTPTITYSPNFVQSISGEIANNPATFAGRVYMGELTFSNIVLTTGANMTYDIYLDYVPSYVINNIDNASVYIITNFGSTSETFQEAELEFSSQASIDNIGTFSLTGTPAEVIQ